jgi:hypothetical protein
LKAGVNYLPYNLNVPEIALRRDFQLFQTNKIDFIAIDPRWVDVEPTKGSYSTTILSRMKNIIQIAAEYGISVAVWWMTNTRGTGGTVPSWVSPRKFRTVIMDSTTRQAWLNMLDYVANYLSGLPIHSWIPIDEPYFDSTCLDVDKITGKNLLYDSWVDAKASLKQHLPNAMFCGARFGCDAFTTLFDREQRFYDLFDFIVTNYYYPSYNGGNCNRTRCNDEWTAIKAKGKLLFIGGMGDSSANDTTQANNYKGQLDDFKLRGVDGCACWFWKSTDEFGGFNICKNTNGEPRPAFYTLASYNVPIEPQPQTITLNVVAGTGGTVSPSGSQTLTIGQNYSFKATARRRYRFYRWQLNGNSVGTRNPISLKAAAEMNEKTLKASFRKR